MNEKIINLRKLNNLSQEEFCSLMGVSRPTLSAIEKGTRKLKAQEIKTLSENFYLNISYFYNEKTIEEEVGARDSILFSRAFTNISPLDLEEILEYIYDKDYLSEKGKDFRTAYWKTFIQS